MELHRMLIIAPWTLTAIVTASYLLLYTGFSKAKKTLDLNLLVEVLLFKRGTRHSLVEFNKALSLVGLTLLLLAFLPPFAPQRKEMLWIAMNALWVHSLYSIYNFYPSLKKIMNEGRMKQLSTVLGSLSHMSLVAGFFGYLSPTTFVWASTLLGMSHFWTMEVDYKYRLQVRPWAYLPFVLAAGVVAFQSGLVKW